MRVRATALRDGAFLLAAAGFVAVLGTHLIDFGTDHLHAQVFDAGSDSSWSHRLVAASLAAATAVAVLGLVRSQRARGLWATAVAILSFLAIDEISSLHTHVDDLTWGKALYAPLLVVLAVCVWRLAGRGDRGLVVRVGLAMLVVSFGIHVFGPHVVHALGWGADSWAYQVKVGLKQGTELAGWLLLLVGLWRLALNRQP
jgi:hypothetical protein